VAVLNLWPPESDSDQGRASLWRGALAIAIAGFATLVLLGVVVLECGSGGLAAIWISFGLPVVLLFAAAARTSASRVEEARRRTTEGTSASPRVGQVSRIGNDGFYRDRRRHKFSNGGHDANASLNR
jgi:hypothetical protein